MTRNAWIFMGVSWALIIGMTLFCFYKLLTSQRQLGGDDRE
jgi:hypothetical protein